MICVSSKAWVASLITSAKNSDNFLTVFSIVMFPTGGNTDVIVCINNGSVIPQVE